MVVLTGTSDWADPEQCRWGLHSHSAPPLWSRQGQSPCALWRSCPFLKKMQWLQVACFMKLTEQLWQWLLDEDDANQCGKGFFCESDTKPSFWSLDLVGSLVEKPTSWNIWQWPNHPQQRLWDRRRPPKVQSRVALWDNKYLRFCSFKILLFSTHHNCGKIRQGSSQRWEPVNHGVICVVAQKKTLAREQGNWHKTHRSCAAKNSQGLSSK